VKLALAELSALRRQLNELYRRREHLDMALANGEQLLRMRQEQLLAATEPVRKPYVGAAQGVKTAPDDTVTSLDDIKRQALMAALAKAKGNRQQAARLMGVSRNALYRMLERYKDGGAYGGRDGAEIYARSYKQRHQPTDR
jgi:transcriptional regulator of acetoin/glycerol metabolism